METFNVNPVESYNALEYTGFLWIQVCVCVIFLSPCLMVLYCLRMHNFQEDLEILHHRIDHHYNVHHRAIGLLWAAKEEEKTRNEATHAMLIELKKKLVEMFGPDVQCDSDLRKAQKLKKLMEAPLVTPEVPKYVLFEGNMSDFVNKLNEQSTTPGPLQEHDE